MYGTEGLAEYAPEVQFAFSIVQISKYALCRIPGFPKFYIIRVATLYCILQPGLLYSGQDTKLLRALRVIGHRLKSVASSARNARDLAGGLSLNSVLANLAQNTAVSARERTRAREGVGNTGATKSRLASRVVLGRSVERSRVVLDGGLDVLKHGALDEGVGVLALEGVALDVIPVVVGHVHSGAAAELGGAAAGVVDVVVLEGDGVALAGEVDAPVVVGVALGGPAGAAVDEVVGDGYAVIAAVAGDDVLATDEGSL